jgi:flagellar biosynthesis/type III secretory pathway protein FliH
MLADYWEKQRRDAQAALDYAREEGLEKGLEKGRAAGWEEGLEKGREESRRALAEREQEIAELQRRLKGKEN